MSSDRSKPRRTYVVEYEKVDVWVVPIEAPNKREAIRRFRAGEFDLDDTVFSSHEGDGKVLGVERDDDY